MSIRLFSKESEEYFGAKHPMIGLVLVLLGAFSLFSAGLALSAPDEFPKWFGLGCLAWGVLAIPFGFSMRRNRPSAILWILAHVMLTVFVATMLAFVFLVGR